MYYVIKMKLNNQTIGYINLVEKITKAKVKDCFLNEEVIFIIEEGDMGKAIGKKGENVRKLRSLMKKKIRLVEFNRDGERFIKNLISPINGNVYKEDNEILVEVEKRDKAMLIGRDRSRINRLKSIFNHYYKGEIRVK